LEESSPAPPPPDDPYRRIEAALARIRKDLPPSEPADAAPPRTPGRDREEKET
jgi:hypothetical protein